MGQNFEKVASGINLVPQPTVNLTNPANGDMAYDLTRKTHVVYVNGNWTDIQSRTDVTSAASMTSVQFTAGVAQSSIARITGSTAGSIHGVTASSDAKTILIYNESSQSQILKHQSGTEATAVNRIISPTAGDITLPSGQTIELQYDSDQSRWIIVATISSFTNPMTTAGDLIIGGGGGSPTRLGIGADGTVLTVATGAEVWALITGANLTSNINLPGAPTVTGSAYPILASTTSSAAPYRTVSGYINSVGVTQFGQGFTSSHVSNGVNDITFSPGFLSTPVIMAIGYGVNAIATATITNISTNGCRVSTYQQSGAVTTVDFMFIALGPI